MHPQAAGAVCGRCWRRRSGSVSDAGARAGAAGPGAGPALAGRRGGQGARPACPGAWGTELAGGERGPQPAGEARSLFLLPGSLRVEEAGRIHRFGHFGGLSGEGARRAAALCLRWVAHLLRLVTLGRPGPTGIPVQEPGLLAFSTFGSRRKVEVFSSVGPLLVCFPVERLLFYLVGSISSALQSVF